MKRAEYLEHDACGLAAAVRQGSATPQEISERAISQIDALNGQVNAVVRRLYDRAERALEEGLPDGPLRGVPMLIKDLGAHIAGVPTTGGSRMYEGYVPDFDAEIVRRYERAGAVVLGKTNTPELGLMGVTESKLLGPARNPWALDRTPGGSSGGSAAAVALRLTPIAHASDGGGSIRIPASCTGLVGLKPSRGRVPNGPHVGGDWSGFLCQHVVCRSVRDTALLLDVAAGEYVGEMYSAPPPANAFASHVGRDPGKLRIGFSTDTIMAGKTDPVVVEAVEAAAKLCEGLGHTVEPAAPALDRRTLARTYLAIIAANTYAEVEAAAALVGRRPGPKDLEPSTRLMYDIGRKSSAGELVCATQRARGVARTMVDFHHDYDIFMLATMATPPAKIGQFAPKAMERAVMQLLRWLPLRAGLAAALRQAAKGMLQVLPNTQPFNMSGQPAISLPLATGVGGLPIGIQLVAPYGREDRLIRLASQLEQAAPWADRRPPLLGAD